MTSPLVEIYVSSDISSCASILIIQGDGDRHSQSSTSDQQQYLKGKSRKSAKVELDKSNRYGTSVVGLALSHAGSLIFNLIFDILTVTSYVLPSFFALSESILFFPEFLTNLMDCGASLSALQLGSLVQSPLWMDLYALLLP